jgi:hypothetical protein
MNSGLLLDEEYHDGREIDSSATAACVPTFYAYIDSSQDQPTSDKNCCTLLCNQLTKFASMVCCCSPGGHQNARSWRLFKSSLQIWLSIVLTILYCLFKEMRIHPWVLNTVWIFFARVGGKLTKYFVISGMVFAFRSLLLHRNQGTSGWRDSHVYLMLAGLAGAVVHTVSHAYHMLEYTTNLAIESYVLITGIVLWIIFLMQAAPYIALNCLKRKKGADGKSSARKSPEEKAAEKEAVAAKEKYWKRFFRDYHSALYLPFAVACAFHCMMLIPLVLFFIWKYLQRLKKMQIKKIFYHFKEDKTLSLIAQVNMRVPFEFGNYCQVEIAGVCASYSMIPIEDDYQVRLSTFGGARRNFMRFIIKESVLTQAFEERLNLPDVRPRFPAGADVLPGGMGFLEIDKDDFDMQIFGPYHFTEMTIRSASNTHLVVLVGTNGISVTESVLNFAKYHTNFWKKLIIIKLCGSSAPTEQDLQKNNISTSREKPINLRLADTDDDDRDDVMAPLLQQYTAAGSLAIADSVWSSIVNEATADDTPALSFQIYGALTATMVGKLIRRLEGLHNAPNCVHYLICSHTWSQLIDEADSPQNKFSHDLWNRLHYDKFGV